MHDSYFLLCFFHPVLPYGEAFLAMGSPSLSAITPAFQWNMICLEKVASVGAHPETTVFGLCILLVLATVCRSGEHLNYAANII